LRLNTSEITKINKKTKQKGLKTFGNRKYNALLCTRFGRGTPAETTVLNGLKGKRLKGDKTSY
jgi:hypothetical protein